MSAEAVLFTPAVGLAILRVVSLLLIPALPLAVVGGASAVTGPARVRLTPYVEIAALAIGVFFAPLLLIASGTGDILSLSDIFRSNGPWDLGFVQFLSQRVVPLLISPGDLLVAVSTGHASADVVRGTILLSGAAFAVVAGPMAIFRDPAGVGNGVRNLLLILWAAYATIYTVAVLLWLANILNFWCFLVLFAATLFVHD